MSRSQSSSSGGYAVNPGARSWTTLAAFVIGLPLAAAILVPVHLGLLGDCSVVRYVHHPVENVEVLLFCCALGALLSKFWCCRTERAACAIQVLPAWDGLTVSLSGTEKLWAEIQHLGRRFHNTYLVRRITAVLDFVLSRKSAAELDDHLRTLADNDSVALESSYSLIRFITWAIPILGFLGTVLGITQSISNVDPDTLDKKLGEVTSGLALAFDATALALGLTMITMFLSFLVDRAEQAVLQMVDRYADEQLAHRFERTSAKGAEFVEVVRQNTQVLVHATEELVKKQAEVWAKAFAEVERQRSEGDHRQQKIVMQALEAMLERTLDTHVKRLAGLEKQVVEQGAGLLEQLAVFGSALRDTGHSQQAQLAQVMQSVTAQAQALAHLQGTETQLIQLQETLTQNLNALAGAGAFDQAVHNLTAAIHMLTSRTLALPSGGTNRLGQRAA